MLKIENPFQQFIAVFWKVFSIICFFPVVSLSGGTPSPAWGTTLSCPGVPHPLATGLAGVHPGYRPDQGTSRKGPGTRHRGYPLWTDEHTENITFPRTSCESGNKKKGLFCFDLWIQTTLSFIKKMTQQKMTSVFPYLVIKCTQERSFPETNTRHRSVWT